jgi:hypothetical protein
VVLSRNCRGFLHVSVVFPFAAINAHEINCDSKQFEVSFLLPCIFSELRIEFSQSVGLANFLVVMTDECSL